MENYVTLFCYIVCIVLYFLHLANDIAAKRVAINKLIAKNKFINISSFIKKLNIVTDNAKKNFIYFVVQRKSDLLKTEGMLLDTSTSIDILSGGTLGGLYDEENNLLCLANSTTKKIYYTLSGLHLFDKSNILFDRVIFILAGLYFTYLYVGNSFSIITVSFFGQLIFWEIIIAIYEKFKFSFISKEVSNAFIS